MTIATWIDQNPAEFLAWLAAQRWYGDKSRTIRDAIVQPLAETTIDGVGVALMTVRVFFDQGDESVYFAPLVQRGAEAPEDAADFDGFLQWLASGFDDGRRLALLSGQEELVWRRQMSGSNWTHLEPQLLTGEQSNSSVIFGRTAILKLFRKVQPGINPDSEIVSFLTSEGSFSHVPAYLGSIVQTWDDGREDVELATVQSFIANEGDCWRWLPRALHATVGDDRASLTEAIGLLGARTGELHAALSRGTGDAFAPEPITVVEVQDLVNRLAREVKLTSAMLFQHGAISHDDEESLVAGLMANVTDADVLVGGYRIRVHGDYHLGQVLRSAGDFIIIDFEGEPSRSMAERRQKHSPLKDVAGMLRSIDYAVASASQNLDARHVAALRAWGEEVGSRFLLRYRQAVRQSLTPLLPQADRAFDTALDLFMTEKALYEVRYELNNRPDWLDIPLSALQRIAMKV